MTSRIHTASMLLSAVLISACGDDSPTGPGDGGNGGSDGPGAAVTLSAQPEQISLAPGQRGTVQISLARVGGYAGSVSLVVEGAPAPVRAEIAPTSLSGTGSQASVSLAVPLDAVDMTFALRVRARGSGVDDATVDVPTTVAGSFGYSLRAVPEELALRRGETGTVTLEVEGIGGFSGVVHLTTSAPGGGITPSVEPDSATPAEARRAFGVGSSTLTVAVGPDVAPGDYHLVVTGSADGFVDRVTSVSLTVTEAPTVVAAPTPIVTGAEHACAVESDGAPVCWGSNGRGQLGDAGRYPAQISAHRTPIVVQEAPGAFSQFAAGEEHTCAIDEGGQAWCWGRNLYGQLGDGTTSDAARPVAVQGGFDWVKLVAGVHHTCGLVEGGEVHCWGGNFLGQLGDGSTVNAAGPVRVAGEAVFGELSAAGQSTCAVSVGGVPYCWGNLLWAGQASEPTPAPTTLLFSAFETGPAHACGIADGGAVHCVGGNAEGQLGDGSTAARTELVPVSGGIAFSSVTVGSSHTCGVATGGQGYCWGGDRGGELGDGAGLTARTTPTPVEGGLTWKRMTAASGQNPSTRRFTCGLTTDDLAYCWGWNANGQLGNGTLDSSPLPVAVAGRRTFETIEAGLAHTCALAAGGEAFCFGANGDGRLGTGDTQAASLPKPAAGGLQLAAVSGGRTSTCALDSQGTAYCWGANGGGELGNGTTASAVAPVPVTGGATYAQVSMGRAGFAHACGITTAGSVECWGYNQRGQLGDGGLEASAVPRAVAIEGVFTQVVTGDRFTCALRNDGEAFCWGYNQFGSLGNGATALNSPMPTPVVGGLRFQTLAARDLFVCALDLDGAAWCWGGRGAQGQLGNGSTDLSTVPVPVGGGHTFRDVAVGGGEISANTRGHACAIDTDDALWCWGHNGFGQLGDGATEHRTQPVAVAGGRRFRTVTLGGWFTCGVTTTDHVYCWGDAGDHLGDGNPLGAISYPKRMFY